MPIVSALAAVAARGYGFLQGRFSDFELIETQTVGAGGAANITFNSIPGTYKHLQIRFIARSSRTGAGGDFVAVRLNGDTGANYSEHSLYGQGSGNALSAGTANTTSMNVQRIAGGDSGSNIFGAVVIDILDYTSTSKNTTIRSLGGFDGNGSGEIHLDSGAWRNTNAVTSIVFQPQGTNTFAQYSTFSLYGVK